MLANKTVHPWKDSLSEIDNVLTVNSQNPTELPEQRLQEKISELEVLIRHKQEVAEQRSSLCGMSKKTWKRLGYTLSGAGIFAGIFNGLSSSLSLTANNNCHLPGYVLALSFTAVTLASLQTIFMCIYNQQEDKRQSVEQKSEEWIKEARQVSHFLRSIALLHTPLAQQQPQVSDQHFHKCIQELHHIPLTIPARDRWISAVIQLLPPESTVRHNLSLLNQQAQEMVTRNTQTGFLQEDQTDRLGTPSDLFPASSTSESSYEEHFNAFCALIGIEDIETLYYNNSAINRCGILSTDV